MRGDALAARVALGLFLLCGLIYAGTAKGVLEQVDDVAMLRVTEALVRTRGVAVPPDTPGAMPGVDGQFYTRYGIGQSLLAIPFFGLASRLPQSVQAQGLFDPHGFVTSGPIAMSVTAVSLLASAGSVSLLYLTVRALGYSHQAGIGAALALGLGTFVWHYARTFLSEPASMFSILLSFYGLARFRSDRHPGWAAMSGAAAGFAVLMRIGNAVLLLPLGLWLVWLARRDRASAVQSILAWGLPALLFCLALAAYNVVRFGTPLETGYADQAQAFNNPLYVGLYGLLLSPGKSVFLYAPLVLAGVIGWWRLPRDVLAVILGMVAAYLVFYARFDWWYGGGPWGPRFLLVVLPFACLGIAPLLDARLGSAWKLSLAGLAVVSFAVQVVSISVPYLPYEAGMVQDQVSFDRLIWHPAYSPLTVAIRGFIGREYPLDLALTYYPLAWVGWAQVTFLVAAVAMLVGGAAWAGKHLRRS